MDSPRSVEDSSPSVSGWELLKQTQNYRLQRSGRYIVAELLVSHLTASTSVPNGGQHNGIRFLVNHQSCEASAHEERHAKIVGRGLCAYHDEVCAELGLPPEEVALMGTAANMNYVAVVTRLDNDLEVTAVVTAGVQGNAACAGDPANWREGEQGWKKVNGTINTMVLINAPLTHAAMGRAIVTMTEAKSAALQQLAIPSMYSADLATGTGTDQFVIAALENGNFKRTAAGPHVKLGELIGTAVRDATLESLRWQNGLEPSFTRSIFHALGRYGLKEQTFFDQIASFLKPEDLQLMRRNSKSVFYEPLVSAAAYAMASALDRVRYGTIPPSAAHEALRHQAASIATGLSARPQLWNNFHNQLTDDEPLRLLYRAIALGWAAKWLP